MADLEEADAQLCQPKSPAARTVAGDLYSSAEHHATYGFSYEQIDHLTRLGWVAKVPRTPGNIVVLHGNLVETRDDWFVEGCWDGPVESGDFDRSDCFFGSGMRLRDGQPVAVASRATIDNIVYCEGDTEVVISNSLLLLLAAVGAQLDKHHSYEEVFSGALRGIDGYEKSIPVVHPALREVSQLYFGNLRVRDGHVAFALPPASGSFGCFDDYFRFLADKMAAIHANAVSTARRFPMGCYATLSTGYDSTAVAVLARQHCGVERCITTECDASASAPQEDARPLAEMLGLEPYLIAPPETGLGSRELYYYGANFQHFEMIFDNAARLFEAQPCPTLLLTGYHGDKVWDKNLREAYQGDDIRRGDMSGKGLGEIRLRAGFINAAIPFLGARKIAQLVAISNSPEMAPWSVGGDYDRPIPRRICETAGLPRQAFGRHKHKITSHKARPVDAALRASFTRDLKEEFGLGSGRLFLYDVLDRLAYRLNRFPGSAFLAKWKRALIRGKPNLRMALFIWAANRIVGSLDLAATAPRNRMTR